MPPHEKQGLKDHNCTSKDPYTYNTEDKGKGKKSSKKKSSQEAPSQPGTSTAGVVPRTEFQSRNLGTGRSTIQCTACNKYRHWRRGCPYKNVCTTCNSHDHTTHMCRAPRNTPQQSPVMCLYCGSSEHSTTQCHNRPWDNREQPCRTAEETRQQRFQQANGKSLGNAQSDQHVDTQEDNISRDCMVKVSGNSGSY